jgi:hypothetical protein
MPVTKEINIVKQVKPSQQLSERPSSFVGYFSRYTACLLAVAVSSK